MSKKEKKTKVQESVEFVGVKRKEPDIKFIKLKNGENLISVIEFDEQNPNSLTLHNPLKLLLFRVQTEEGVKMQQGFEDYLPEQIVDMPVTSIRVSDILLITGLNKEYEKSIRKMIMKEHEEKMLEESHTDPNEADDLVNRLKRSQGVKEKKASKEEKLKKKLH